MLLFFRNLATNAFQVVMGVFLSSSGASRRIIDTFNHMGLSVNYQWVLKVYYYYSLYLNWNKYQNRAVKPSKSF